MATQCDPKSCQYHQLTDRVMEDLRDAVSKITESQMQVKESMASLIEGFKAMDRLEKRQEKQEELQRAKDQEQDLKIDQLRIFMYKALGVAALAVPLLTMAAQVLLTVFFHG